MELAQRDSDMRPMPYGLSLQKGQGKRAWDRGEQCLSAMTNNI